MSNCILVTGGAGFIGVHVVRILLEHGYTVVVIDNHSSKTSTLLRDWPGVEVFDADLRNPFDARILPPVDACIALAARNHGVGFFSTHPAEILHDNVLITANTFELCRACNVERVVYVSSSCVFDSGIDRQLTELDAGVGDVGAGYPFSKRISEKFCIAYRVQYALRYTIVRPFNVYGPGELPGETPGESHVIPDLTAKVLRQHSPLTIFGDGSQTRSFTHARDVARGIHAALESSDAVDQDFNIGSNREICIRDLARMLWEICHGNLREFSLSHELAFTQDVQRRAVDPTKSRDVLGWYASIPLEDGLRETVDWIRSKMSK